MPIALICPGCKVRLSVGDDRSGTTFDCPKCFTRISVPVLDASPPPSPTPEPPREVDYEPEPKRARERDYDPDPDYRPPRRRKEHGVSMAAVLGVAVLGVLALIMVIVVVSSRRDRADAHKAGKAEPSGTHASTRPTRAERPEVSRAPESRTSERTTPNDDSGGVGGMILGLFLIVFGLAFYFAPTIIAVARGHNNIAPIVVVNFFLGWLLIGWVIALAWAFTDLKHLERKRRSYL